MCLNDTHRHCPNNGEIRKTFRGFAYDSAGLNFTPAYCYPTISVSQEPLRRAN